MHRALLAAIAATLLLTGTVMAASSVMFTGTTKTWKEFMTHPVTTAAVGDLTLTVTYEPNANGAYVILLESASGTEPYRGCSSQDHKQMLGTLTCTIADAPIGTYNAQFKHWLGSKVRYTMTVTGELE